MNRRLTQSCKVLDKISSNRLEIICCYCAANSDALVLGIKGVDVVVADVNDQESIEAMCAKTRVVVNVVGPVGAWIKLDWFKNKSICMITVSQIW